jgi:hypothetical protein
MLNATTLMAKLEVVSPHHCNATTMLVARSDLVPDDFHLIIVITTLPTFLGVGMYPLYSTQCLTLLYSGRVVAYWLGQVRHVCITAARENRRELMNIFVTTIVDAGGRYLSRF